MNRQCINLKLLRPEIPLEIGGIPSEYVAVDGINFYGTEFIDTGINQLGDIDVSIDFRLASDVPYTRFVFGSRLNYNDSSFSLLIEDNRFRSDYSEMISILYPIDLDLERHVVKKCNGKTYFDDVLKATVDERVLRFTGSLFVGNTNTNGSNMTTAFKGTVYSFKINKSGALVQNLVPVRRILDNVYGMWDTVTEMFFGNSGSGKFGGGDDLFE